MYKIELEQRVLSHVKLLSVMYEQYRHTASGNFHFTLSLTFSSSRAKHQNYNNDKFTTSTIKAA